MKHINYFLLAGVIVFLIPLQLLAENNLYKAGVVFYNQGKYEEALQYLSKAIKKEPDNVEAIYYFANTLVKTYNVGYAEKYYNKVIDMSPDSEIAFYSRQALNDIARYKSNVSFPYNSLVLKGNQLYTSDNSYIHLVKEKGDIIHWQKSKMPIKVYVSPYKHSENEEYAWDAFKEWQLMSDSLILFERVESKESADIIVDWQNTFQYDLQYDLYGFVIPEIEQNEIRKYYIYLLTSDENAKDILPKKLYMHALHLIGHSLGITAHSDVVDDIMYETGNDGNISRRDISTLNLIYELPADISNFSDYYEPKKPSE